MEIAAVMGGYYWMGFVGGLLLTAYQIHGLLWGEYTEVTWKACRSHIVKLGVGLLLGSATLLVEAEAEHNEYASMHTVHLNCRLVQGFLGAFLFFYAYYLAATMFEGSQQVFALTLATICLNVAEVFGPFLGAWIFSEYGHEWAYYSLALLSVLNNVFLLVVWWVLPNDPVRDADESTALLDGELPHRPPSSRTPREAASSVSRVTSWADNASFLVRYERLRKVLVDPILIQSIIVIAPAAMVKSSFESILPLFGDNHGFSVFEVGVLFTMVALGFITSSVGTGYIWERLSKRAQVWLVGISLFLLGCVACIMLHSWGHQRDDAYGTDVIRTVNNGEHHLFYVCLVVYGFLLGLTHCGASLYLGEVIDYLEDEKSKGAANGIWNTGWELGGSIGFAVAGSADTDSWKQEQRVLKALGILLFVATIAFAVLVNYPDVLTRQSFCDGAHDRDEVKTEKSRSVAS
jgi:MFS family permease